MDGTARGTAVRAPQAAQAPWRVPCLPTLPKDSVPADRADRDHAGQRRAAPVDRRRRPRRRLGGGDNVELVYTSTNASWLNRIEAQFTALRYFTLDGTDHGSHRDQASMIRRYLAWRNRRA
jgi:hypothetical protein